MVEVGHRTRFGTINLCVLGYPLPPYIKEQGGEAGRPLQGAPGGGFLLVGVGLPFPTPTRRGKGRRRGRRKEREERRKGGTVPLVQFGLG